MAVFYTSNFFKKRSMATFRKALSLTVKILVVTTSFATLLNCSSLPQRDAVVDKMDAPNTVAPSSTGQSDIVFVRTSLVASAVDAHLYNVSNAAPEYVATMPNNTKLEYPLLPGRHMFMLVSEDSVDFIRVDASAPRTYYSLVEPHMGVWKPSFSITPVKLNGVDSLIDDSEPREGIVGEVSKKRDDKVEEVKNRLNDAKWIGASDQTPPEIDGNIDARYREAWKEWVSKSAKEQDAKTLNAIDGVIESS